MGEGKESKIKIFVWTLSEMINHNKFQNFYIPLIP